MKMIFNLVKKDFMLIRKTVALIMLVVIGFPIFFAFQFEAEEAFDSMGTVIFGALAFMCTFMIYHSIWCRLELRGIAGWAPLKLQSNNPCSCRRRRPLQWPPRTPLVDKHEGGQEDAYNGTDKFYQTTVLRERLGLR